MKKSVISAFVLTVFVMFVLPFLAVKLAPADAGMALCMILFLSVNPIFSIALGVFSGLEVGKRWFLPLVSTVAFVFAALLWFALDFAFLIYALAYLVLGVVSLAITCAFKHGSK